jgi:pimeloyl-ACP methyl ester carboxylesterase
VFSYVARACIMAPLPPGEARLRAIVGALAGLALASTAAAAEPPAGWWVRYADPANLVALPDGRRINLYCEGQGSPVVVMDSGLGDNAASWRGVQDPIAQTTRVCVYDRAGLGLSTPDAARRDTRRMVDDLAAALKAARVKGPYVLVGHSAAGLTVRLYASLHRKDVVGLVLVDPSVENQIDRFAAVAPAFAALARAGNPVAKPCSQDPRPANLAAMCGGGRPTGAPEDVWARLRSPSAYQTGQAELTAFQEMNSQEVIAARKPFGALPLVILTATRHPAPGITADEAAVVEREWNRMHDEVATLSTHGENRRIEGAAHYIHGDHPQVVIDAVVEVVTAARTNARK